MADIWYWSRQGDKQGPVSLEAIKQAVMQGQVLPTDLVWKTGLSAWVPAHTVPELMPAGHAPSLGYYTPPPVTGDDIGQNAGIRMLLPVGRSGWAIVAGYLGLFSLLILPAPIALIIAIIAVGDIRKHPERHGMGRAIFGLVMGGLGTLAILIAIGNLVLHR